MTHEEIAIALGITKPTLYKHFEYELAEGAYRRRCEVLEALHKAAVDGNVSACKAYAALTPTLAAPPVPEEKPEDKPPEGKKAQAQADAQTAHLADPEWASLLHRPKLPQ
jgi:AcrR family transcriptional regulator